MFFQDYLSSFDTEKDLEKLFPKEVFIKLGLNQNTIPLFSQGLPRILDPASKDYLRLKKGFENIDVLKTKILDKPLLSLFSSKKKLTKKLLILTYVVPGGYGDLFCQKELKKLLKKTFEELEITSILCIHSQYRNKIPCEEEILLFYDTGQELTLDLFPSDLLSLFKTIDIVIEIPTLFPLREALKKELKKDGIWETIGEYGFIQSEHFLPHTNRRSLGLHFLEIGIFLPDVKPKSVISYPILPSGREIDLSMGFYFSYLITEYGHLFYLFLLLELNQKRDILLLAIDIGVYLKIIETNLENLQAYPLKEIVIFYQNHKTSVNIKKEGISLKIFHTGPLSHEDFLKLMSESSEPIGVRGNLSLSEAISMKKGFVYDLLDHNLSFYYEILSLTKEFFPRGFDLIQLFKKTDSPLEASKKGAKAIKNGALNQIKELCEFIKKRLSADDHLCNLVAKSSTFIERPGLKKKEQQIVALFQKGTLSFEESILSLQKEINS